MSDTSEALPLDPTKLVVAALSDPGRVRTDNQDTAAAFANVSNERLLIVADGVGGHRGGETASKLCVDTLGRIFRDPHGTPEERLRRGLELANEEVYSQALSKPELKGMGTTAVALLFSIGTRGVWLAWVGDSRCYRLRAGLVEALTRDHSLMAEWVEMGVIRPEEVANHPRRNELTRAIGQAPDVVVDVVRVAAQPGDRFLLCSDGIHAPVSDRALKAALGGHPPEDAARLLVERANANGGPDNATVIVIDVPPEAFHEGAVEQMPEVPLELELPSPPPPPPQAAAPEPPQAPEPPPPLVETAPPESVTPESVAPPEPAPSTSFGDELDLEPNTHSSAAIDAAIAELTAARGAIDPAAPLDGSDSGSSLPQMFETPTPPPPAPAARSAEDLAAETSFADLLDDGPSEPPLPPAPPPEQPLTPPAPSPAARATPAPAPAFDFGAELPSAPSAAALNSPSLVAPPPARPIRIPLMTPVRKRRGMHAGSLLTGLAAGVVVAAVAVGAWLYTEGSHSGAWRAPLPAVPQQRTATLPPAQPRAVPPAATPAPRVAPLPTPTPAPAPEPVARAVTSAPTPEPAVTPQPPAPTPAPAPAPAPTPIAMPDSPRPPPTTVVIVRPPGPTPTTQIPAAPDGSAVTPPLPTAAGFELAPPVRRFVDDWLRAQETHDAPLFTSLGFRELPTELLGSWNTRDAYRLVDATVDEERSTAGLVYLRVVVSYAFRDGTGRFRTEDEERMILRSSGGTLRFEGRWQQ
jgi:protein phosphatase